MKKSILVIIFFFSASFANAQTQQFDITSPFKLWLLNNEAKVFSSLSSDEMLINKVLAPFSFMPAEQPEIARAEERIWEIHRKIYALLDEAQNIYAIARRYGNGRFAIILKQARPEIWSLLPIHMVRPGVLNILAADYRKAFHNTLLKCLQLDAVRDIDLSNRLGMAVKKLSDEEYRLLTDYFATFAGLFPTDKSLKMIKTFIESGSKKKFATGLREFLKPTFTTQVFADVTIASATTEPEDPLAELEKLAQFEDSNTSETSAPEAVKDGADANGEASGAKPATTLEPPPPGTEDLFNIWD